jgi:hypothetical protein
MTSKIGLHSSFNRFESDPRFGYVRHIMQQLVVVRNDDGGSHVRYDLQFTERKELWEELVERCKKHLIKEVLQGTASNNKSELENTVSAELDQLKREGLELVEVDKTRSKIEPRTPSENGKPKSHHAKRSSVSYLSKQEAIPEDAEVQGGRSKSQAEFRLPRTDSSLSVKRVPRTNSMKSQGGTKKDSKRPSSFLSRMISRDSTHSHTPVQSPMQSPRASNHLFYPGISTSA